MRKKMKKNDEVENEPLYNNKEKLFFLLLILNTRKICPLHPLHSENYKSINAVIHPMGALQSCLSSSSMISRDWPLLEINLKDCFFAIPLAREDKENLAYSVCHFPKG